jgi:hypothetical protein
MTDQKAKPEPPYVDDPTIREAYAESVQTLFGEPGILRVELCANRWTQYTPVHIRCTVPVARFAIHISVAKELQDQLTRRIEAMENDAKLAQAPASPTKQ